MSSYHPRRASLSSGQNRALMPARTSEDDGLSRDPTESRHIAQPHVNGHIRSRFASSQPSPPDSKTPRDGALVHRHRHSDAQTAPLLTARGSVAATRQHTPADTTRSLASPRSNKRRRITSCHGSAFTESIFSSSVTAGGLQSGQQSSDHHPPSPSSYLGTHPDGSASNQAFGASNSTSIHGDYASTLYRSNSESVERGGTHSHTTPSPLAPTMSTPDIRDDLAYGYPSGTDYSHFANVSTSDWSSFSGDPVFATGAMFSEDMDFMADPGNPAHSNDFRYDDEYINRKHYTAANPTLSLTPADFIEHSPSFEPYNNRDSNLSSQAFGLDPVQTAINPLDDRSSTAICNECGESLTGKYRKRNLKRHIASVHNPMRFYCDVSGCNRSYRRSDAVHAHKRKSHPT